MIRNKVNPEELHWSGVDKAFQPGQKVTAEELAGHFESKLPQVQETVYGSKRPNEYVPGKPLTDEFKAHRHFDVTPELLERIRKGFPAYRDGGEVNDALVLAQSL